MSKEPIGKRNGGVIPPRRWRNADTLQAVMQTNEYLLQLLRSLAVHSSDRYAIEVIRRHRRLWLRCDAHAMKCAAQCPVLLIDVHFAIEAWWKWVLGHAAHGWKGEPRTATFSPKTAKKLMLATLMLAWHAAREGQDAAQVLFGMSPGVATMIAKLTPTQIESIASRHSRELRPRWENVPNFWQTLLSAAQRRDRARLRTAHLYGVQLVASELSDAANPSS